MHLRDRHSVPRSTRLMNILPNAQLLSLEGADAIAFAQAQFSSKVSALGTGQWQFSAWLSAQGRVRSLFHLMRTGQDRLLLLLRGGSASDMAGALQRFVFRSKVVITPMPAGMLECVAAMPLHAIEVSDGVITLGCGNHGLRISLGAGNDAWRPLQSQLGWPWLPEALLDELLPPALSLQRLQAVVVDKGCYPGQEIVARLHFRGGNKRHLHRVTLSQAVTPGEHLRRNGKNVGCVLEVTPEGGSLRALAVLDDELAETLSGGRTALLDDAVSVHIETSWAA